MITSIASFVTDPVIIARANNSADEAIARFGANVINRQMWVESYIEEVIRFRQENDFPMPQMNEEAIEDMMAYQNSVTSGIPAF